MVQLNEEDYSHVHLSVHCVHQLWHHVSVSLFPKPSELTKTLKHFKCMYLNCILNFHLFGLRRFNKLINLLFTQQWCAKNKKFAFFVYRPKRENVPRSHRSTKTTRHVMFLYKVTSPSTGLTTEYSFFPHNSEKKIVIASYKVWYRFALLRKKTELHI